MKTDELKVNQLSPSAYEWYLTYLNAMDKLDIDAYATFLAEDCEMQFGNNPLVKGKHKIVESLTAFWATIDSDEHNLQNIYGDDRNFVLEAFNTFKRKDNTSVTVPAVAITEKNEEGLVTSVRLFMDISTLFS
jgi:ketosteroid isomerase-like protein